MKYIYEANLSCSTTTGIIDLKKVCNNGLLCQSEGCMRERTRPSQHQVHLFSWSMRSNGGPWLRTIRAIDSYEELMPGTRLPKLSSRERSRKQNGRPTRSFKTGGYRCAIVRYSTQTLLVTFTKPGGYFLSKCHAVSIDILSSKTLKDTSGKWASLMEGLFYDGNL